MCRIAAIIPFGDNKILPQEVKNFLLQMEDGGKDAVGIMFLGDQMSYAKAPGKVSDLAWDTFMEDITKSCDESKAVILHTRLATHGTPSDNANNHPIIGKKYAMVHNGVVWTRSKYTANGETDTEQMLWSIESLGIKKGLTACNGSISIIMANIRTCDDVFFYTNGYSLYVGWDYNRKYLYLASTVGIITNSSLSKSGSPVLNGIECVSVTKDIVYRADLRKKFVQKMFKVEDTDTYSYSGKAYYSSTTKDDDAFSCLDCKSSGFECWKFCDKMKGYNDEWDDHTEELYKNYGTTPKGEELEGFSNVIP